MFKILPVADTVFCEDNLPDAFRAFARDSIALGWEERLKARGRRVSDRGVAFGTALPRGTILRDGDCLVLEAPRLIVVVAERGEPVFVVEPGTPMEWGLFGYHIGNGHQPVMVTDRALVCPEVPGVEQLLQYHKIPFTRAILPFTPATVSAHHH